MIGDLFYNIFITPIEFIFEVIFWFLGLYPAFAIIAISVVMNFLALPLYMRADAIHEEERDKVASMADRVARIKRAFKGDERYMVLTAYYKEQHYKPIYALRSTFSLLLQVPFFIAAYNFLSRPGLLSGTAFLFLKDLGEPDRLISFGSLQINLMPVIMTLINVISSYIYLKGFSLRDKIQTYGIAVVFLVLLYNSPSGLVFYWTLNQVFSVFKNVFMKLVKTRRSVNIFFGFAGAVIFILLWAFGAINSIKTVLFGLFILLICLMPSIVTLVKKKKGDVFSKAEPLKTSLFVLGGLFNTAFIGMVIPLSVISSSPTEFMTDFASPASLVFNNVCITAGCFIIWLGIYFYMSKPFVRNIFIYAIWLISGISVADFLLFPSNKGVLSIYMVYNDMPEYLRSEKLINMAALIVLCAAFILALRFFKKAIRYVYIIMIAVSVVIAGYWLISSYQQIRMADEGALSYSIRNEEKTDEDGTNGAQVSSDRQKIVHLSKNGRNVIVLMLDRAIGSYFPYIINEKPEIKKQFAGFTYYPNVISFGSHTNFAAPAVFGGYEYTPGAMNKRADKLISEKHNESLLLMPSLFSEQGAKVTVFDPPYAGYKGEWPDLTIYEHLENVSARVTKGAYANELIALFSPAVKNTQKRNMFFYCIMKAAPIVFRNTVYNNGGYYNVSGNVLEVSNEFIYNYSVLKMLPELTEATDSDQDTLLLMDNDTTHATAILQTPEYEPSVKVTSDMFADQERFDLNGRKVKMSNEVELGHYHTNMAAYIQLGKWMDHLRELGVYDNTRIIIVSDHGSRLGQFSELVIAPGMDGESVNPILLVKDFKETEYRESDDFMTNADVPFMAMNGVIDNMINPFTGNPVTSDVDKEEQMITSSELWKIQDNNGYVFDTSDGEWWKVHGNIYDKECWEKVG